MRGSMIVALLASIGGSSIAPARGELHGYAEVAVTIPPTAYPVQIAAFNNHRVIAGTSVGGPTNRPFYWRDSEGFVDIIDAITAGGAANPFGIYPLINAMNNHDRMVIEDATGRSWTFDANTKAVVPIDGVGYNALHSICANWGTCFQARDIDDAGNIAGQQWVVYDSPSTYHYPVGPFVIGPLIAVEYPVPVGYKHNVDLFLNNAGTMVTHVTRRRPAIGGSRSRG